jgi:uncharacterized hydrophobic protein (TIGR00271 family)
MVAVMHLRIVSPTHRTESLLIALGTVPNVVNLVVIEGAARRPAGDLVLLDVPPESSNDVVALLRARGIDRHGSITIERRGTVLSAAADSAMAAAPGSSSEAVIWAEVEARSRAEIELTVSFVLMLVLATLIAAVGILTDSPILVIGAMVIGPEYAPVVGIALGVFRRSRDHATTAARTLLVGMSFGVVAPLLFALVVRAVDGTPATYADGTRSLTRFITHPDGWSVVVAVLAGLAGTISLTQARPSALVGVFISVTTIPAAANIGVAAAYGRGGEVVGALTQLALNLALIVTAGVATFTVERWVDRRVHRRRRPLP